MYFIQEDANMHPNTFLQIIILPQSGIKENITREIIRKKIIIPKKTVDPDNSLVNFIILAESVARAPIVCFWTSLDVFSVFETDAFCLLTAELAFDLLLLWTPS